MSEETECLNCGRMIEAIVEPPFTVREGMCIIETKQTTYPSGVTTVAGIRAVIHEEAVR